jgi:hypothetical protein
VWNESTNELEIEVHSVRFGNDLQMLQSSRRIRVSSDRLCYELSISTTTAPGSGLLPHLTAELVRLE